jgi:hypothetical protein
MSTLGMSMEELRTASKPSRRRVKKKSNLGGASALFSSFHDSSSSSFLFARRKTRVKTQVNSAPLHGTARDQDDEVVGEQDNRVVGEQDDRVVGEDDEVVGEQDDVVGPLPGPSPSTIVQPFTPSLEKDVGVISEIRGGDGGCPAVANVVNTRRRHKSSIFLMAKNIKKFTGKLRGHVRAKKSTPKTTKEKRAERNAHIRQLKEDRLKQNTKAMPEEGAVDPGASNAIRICQAANSEGR